MNTSNEALKPGDKVSINNHHEGIVGIMRVKSVSKTLVTLNDDSQWHIGTGRPKGSNKERFYTGDRLAEYKPEHDDIIARRRAIIALRGYDWAKLTTKQLLDIVGITSSS